MALGWLTENGWPSCAAEDCDHSNVPGTDISIPIQIGIPNTILKGFLAAMNEFIEPFNGPQDQGGWTPTNSVATSNHLGGTATDFNWDDHPMGIADDGWGGSDLIQGDEVPAVRELLDYCEGMVFWGNDWDSPKDSMHFQMGYDTYNNIPKCMDFIHRKVDPATMKLLWVPSWKGGGVTAPPPAPLPGPAPGDSAVQVLYEAVESFGMDDAQKYIGQISAGLTLAQCTNPKRIAMWLAQVGEESGSFVYTEEINKSGPYAPFIGRTWIQITWQANYAAFGAWAQHQGLVDDPNVFVNDPQSLADLKWAGVGPAWYWTIARPAINSLCDQGDIVGVTQLINGGQHGIDDRTARYQHAIALGDRLMLLIAQHTPPVPPPAPPPTTGVITLTVPQEQWDELFNEVCGPVSSQSPFRAVGEGTRWRPSQMWVNDDGMTHPQFLEWAAARGHAPSLAELHALAATDPAAEPDRADDIVLAQQVLARLAAGPTATAAAPTTTTVAVPNAATPHVGANSMGPDGWVGIVGVVLQGVLWLLQQSIGLLPPQWAGVVSGLLAGLTALGIYKAPSAKAPEVITVPLPAPTPAPVEVTSEPDPEPAPQPAPAKQAPPLQPRAPEPPPAPAGSITDALERTQNDAAELDAVLERTQNDSAELADRVSQARTSLGKPKQ